ncbi:DUF7342 family protein [Halorubrum ezzemoulense]|uniref:DUF7342 family protein n=1 Tax=Halorubrum ezzemoulense TaxID=337243 RepID=UPI003D7E4398
MFALAEGFHDDVDSAPSDERVYRVALGLYDPAGVTVVAEHASCAPDTARRYLKRLENIGVVEAVSETPLTYTRNESYFEWRRRNRLENLSSSELRDTLSELTARERAFRDQFGLDAPGKRHEIEILYSHRNAGYSTAPTAPLRCSVRECSTAAPHSLASCDCGLG